jgi:diketogulonate reductase-like aldo/keto reductase
MSLTLRDTVQLTSGRRMPMLGFGTWKLKEGEVVHQAVVAALKAGYRHIDTAAMYENEGGIGQAIRDSRVRREEIFLTTKVWNDSIRAGYDAVLRSCDVSLERLKVGYVDLYLLHWPIAGKDREAWRALETLYRSGKARSIGVCNYLPHHLDALLPGVAVTPMVDQIECHPFLQQPELADVCRRHGIVREAWSPLMQGKVGDVPAIAAIAKRLRRTPEQVVLHWELQHRVVTIPRSANPKHIGSNAGLFDFELTPDDIALLNELDRNQRFGPDPDRVNF